MAYIRKTIDRWDIMSSYGYGWECECSEYSWKAREKKAGLHNENES